MDSFAILDVSNIVTAITESTNVDMAATGLTYVNLTTGGFSGVQVGYVWTGSVFNPPSSPELLPPASDIVNQIPVQATAYIGDVPAFQAVNPGPLGNSYPTIVCDGSSNYSAIVSSYNTAYPDTPIQLTQWVSPSEVPSAQNVDLRNGGYVSNVLGMAGITTNETSTSTLMFNNNEGVISAVFAQGDSAGLLRNDGGSVDTIAVATNGGFFALHEDTSSGKVAQATIKLSSIDHRFIPSQYKMALTQLDENGFHVTLESGDPGTVTDAVNVELNLTNTSTGTINSAMGITNHINNPNGGTIDEGRNFNVGANDATNKYGFYNGNDDSNNYFKKNIIVGLSNTSYGDANINLTGRQYVYQEIVDTLNTDPAMWVEKTYSNTTDVTNQNGYCGSFRSRVAESGHDYTDSYFLGVEGSVNVDANNITGGAVVAVQGGVSFTGSGTLALAGGSTVSVINDGALGVISEAIGYNSEIANDGGGSVTTGYNYKIQNNVATNAWGYHCGLDIKHFLGGETRFGGTDDANPLAKIETNGTFTSPRGIIKKIESPDQQVDTSAGGSTVDISNLVSCIYYDPASVAATLTINLPCDGLGVTADGSMITMIFGGQIAAGSPVVTALTIGCLNGTSTIYGTAPGSAVGGSVFKYVYRSGNDTWYRVQ